MAKKYTQAEWARIQARLPQEDREPYSSSPDIVDTSTKATIDPYYVRDPKTGLSPAQVEANKIVAETAKAVNAPIVTGDEGTTNRVFTPYEKGSTEYLGKTYATTAGAYIAAVKTAEKVGPPGPAPAGLHWNLQGTEWKLYDAEGKPFNYIGTGTEDFSGAGTTSSPLLYKGKPFNGNRGGITYVNGVPKDASSSGGDVYKGSGTTGDPLTLNGVPFTGTRNNARYINGVLQVDSNNNQGGNTTGSGTSSDPLVVNGKIFNGILGGVTYVNGVAQQLGSSNTLTATDIETKARRTAQQDFKAALGELGLADLAEEVDNMIKQDFTVAQIKMELPKTASYQLRFPGMAALRAAGRAINEATYISNEKGYLQTLRAYGLDTNILGSRSALGTYIANEVSPREFEERVNLASTRVNENPEVLETFKSFYPEVDKSGVITYLLNPKAGMAVIKKQVRTSEIGAAAASAGFARDLMGISNIETLLPAVGETAYAGLRTEFQRARQLAQSQRRLAQIENQSYSDLEAIGAVVGDDAAKMLASERRAAREAARFSARGGVTGASLAGPTAI